MKKLLCFLIFILSFFSFGQNRENEDNVIQAKSEEITTENSDLYFEKNDNYYDYEKILAYQVDVIVNTNSSLEVTETIKVNSKGNNISRGIYRTLPIKRNLNNQTFPVKHNIISIKRDGVKDGYHTEKSDEWLKIYIGKEDVILDPGIYTYEIKYSVKKQIGFFTDYDELYWNATGTEWDFSIDNVEVTVHLPDGADIIQNACYTGSFGSNEQNCSSQKIDNTTMVWHAQNLDSSEGLTVAVGFKKGIVQPPPPPGFLEVYGITALLIIVFIYLSYVCYNLWKTHGIDPEKPTVHPQFSPPDNLSPAALGFYHFEKIKKKSITATLTYLAVHKFILIEEIKTKKFFGLSSSQSFRLTKFRDKNSSFLKEEEKSLMRELFKKKNTIDIDGDYDPSIKRALSGYEIAIKNEYEPLLKEGNNAKLLTKPALLYFIAFLVSFIISNFLNENSQITDLTQFLVASIILPVVFFYATRNQAKSVMVGCLKVFFGLMIFFQAIATIFTLIFSVFNSENTIALKSCYAFFFIGGIGLLIMRKLIKKPTVEKLRIQAEIEGFKMYMAAAENEQLKFFNAPKLTPEIFEKYLPYAIMFEVDKIWGDKFNQLILESALSYEPTWYSGSSFNAAYFGSSIATSLTDSFTSSSREPSQSSSSGGSFGGGSSSSGSSGGGSSGGGGGGGGGGGW